MHRKIEEEPILIGHLVRSSETVLENEPEFLSISENLRHKEIIREKKKKQSHSKLLSMHGTRAIIQISVQFMLIRYN